MVSIIVTYEDGTSVKFEHVVKVRYNTPSKNVEIVGDDLITHGIPISRPLWFLTNDGVISINGVGLRFVDVKKE